jgi:hypothetical protein
VVAERKRTSHKRSNLPRVYLLCLAIWCGLGGGGCSAFFVVGPPPKDQRSGKVDCTTSDAYPVADVVMAGLTVVGIAALAGASDTQTRKLAGIGGAPLLGAFVGSGIGGFWRVSKCKQALAGED